MRTIIMLAVLLLTACATTKNIPVPVRCPKPNIPAEPYYPARDLKQGDSAATVVKSYVATVYLQHSYIETLEHILKGYE